MVLPIDWHDTLLARAYQRLNPSRLKRLARGVALALVGSLCLATPTSKATTIQLQEIHPTIYSFKLIGEIQTECLFRIAAKESNIRYNAVNRQSGALGAWQFMNPKVKYLSPQKQVEWAIRYANHRYGSACKAWEFWKVNKWW